MRSLLLLACVCLPALGSAQEATPATRVVAIVNGVEITSDYLPTNAPPGLTGDYESLSREQKEQLLAAQINRLLLLDQAHREGFDQQPEIQQAAQAIADSYIVEQFLLSVAAKFEFGEEAIVAWYQEHYQQVPEQFLVSHILLTHENEAREVLIELVDGASFQDLARDRSMDAISAANSGRIGWLDVREMAPSFYEAVSSLSEGEIEKSPVRTQSGWHVIRLDSRRDTPAPSLASVRGEILKAMAAKQMSDYMDGLRNQASIQIMPLP